MKTKFMQVLAVCFLLVMLNSCGSKKELKPVLTKIYRANFYDTNNQLLQSDSLVYKEFDESFLLVQQKIRWEAYRTIRVNEQTSSHVQEVETSGVIKTSEELWVHPPRFKTYVDFTEFSAFPKVKLPLGDSLNYQSTLKLGTYASKENGSQVESSYCQFKNDSFYVIKSVSRSLRGTYYSEFHYNEKTGFTSFQYTNPKGEQLIIQEIK